MSPEEPDGEGASTTAGSDSGLPQRAARPRALAVAVGFGAVVLAAGAALLVLLYTSVLPISFVVPRIEAAIESLLPPGYVVAIEEASLRRAAKGGQLAVDLRQAVLRSPDGETMFAVPRVTVGLSAPALLTGRLSPRSIRVLRPEIVLVEGERGLGFESGAAPPPPGLPRTGWGVTSVLDALGIVFAMLDERSGIGALEELGVDEARLVVRREEGTATVEPLTLLLSRKAEERTIGFSASLGAEERSRLEGVLRQPRGGDTSVDLALDDFQVADFRPLFPRGLPFLLTTPVGGDLAMRFGPSGQLDALEVQAAFGAGELGVRGARPLQIDEMSVAGSFDRAKGRIRIEPSTLVAGGNRGTLGGEIVLPQRGDFGYGTLPVRLQLTNLRIEDERSGWPAVFPLVSVEALYVQRRNMLNISRLDIVSPEAAASLVGRIGGGRETPAIRLAGSSGEIPVRALKSLWPPFLGKGARRWVVKHVREGRVTDARFNVDIGPDEIASALRGRPLPERAYSLDFEAEDLSFDYLGEMPPLTGAAATAALTPRAFRLKLTRPAVVKTGSGEISVTDGRFYVSDLRPDPALGQVDLSLTGDAGDIAELLNYEPLTLAARRGIDPRKIGGQARIDVGLAMPLDDDIRFADVDVSAHGNVTGLTADGLVGGRMLEKGDIELTVADRWLEIEGDAEIDGLPAELSLRQPLEDGMIGGDRSLAMTLDEATRARMGFDLGTLVEGPVEAVVREVAATESGAAQRIEVDLTKARLRLPELGLDKPAGKAATARFQLTQQEGGTVVDGLVLEGDGLRLEGDIELDRAGELLEASFPIVRLPNGTDVSVRLEGGAGARRIVLEGERLDLRPLLSSARAMASGGDGASRPMNVSVDVERATGNDGREITDLIGSVSTDGKGLKSADLSGILGPGAPVTVSYGGGGGAGTARLSIQGGDAGAFAAFVGIYSHMRGGRLDIRAQRQGGDAPLVGQLRIDSFSLTEDPAVERLIESGNQGSGGRDVARLRGRDSLPVDPGDVRLDAMEAGFSLHNGLLEVRNGVIRGAAVGATVEGRIALASNRLDLHGTYVPLYAINNLFQRVPVFGLLLGGKRNEGLLGITYSLAGTLDSPDLLVNPLSVVTPGVFRYILGMDNPRGGRTAVPETPPGGFR